MKQTPEAKLDLATLRSIPAGVWALGFVSLLMDISSEMIHSLLPLFMVSTLGASATALGVSDRLAATTAALKAWIDESV